ncbi:DUF5318 family protein [Corynebacterium sp. TAE3-ERU30]|uniref:DUF5318 family protein n=1 Tax=Corynebacterium sp. TAE3-ERU30 TaxID=2849496 RepID=UPI001C475376|nr:DUF5318 domain-containing protein [Corynebacterium sp. TAE3-ERU30]
MVEYRNIVSHEWHRRHTLRLYSQGVVTRAEICECDFLLRTAAEFHGSPSSRDCPVCSSQNMRDVLWIYGDEVGRAAGSARSEEEIAQLVSAGKLFDVHRVEVCPDCHWNHLLATMVVSPRTRYA